MRNTVAAAAGSRNLCRTRTTLARHNNHRYLRVTLPSLTRNERISQVLIQRHDSSLHPVTPHRPSQPDFSCLAAENAHDGQTEFACFDGSAARRILILAEYDWKGLTPASLPFESIHPRGLWQWTVALLLFLFFSGYAAGAGTTCHNHSHRDRHIRSGCKRASKFRNVLTHGELEHFADSVDRTFIGIPSIPQKNAEWMGHGGLQ